MTRRMATVAAVAGLAVLGLAGPALAHVEVSADKHTAGASDVTLTFTGEAENDKAGIKSERVVLPAGLDPAGVTLVKAPAGWTFTRAADGFTVAGAPLKIGVDAVWKVKVAKLPDGETRLSFKTLETYGDGTVVRWIEIQEPGQPEPDHPAPLVTLQPGPSSAPSSAGPSPTLSATSPINLTSLTSVSDLPGDEGGSGGAWWVWVVVAVLLIGGGIVLVVRRRSPARGDS
ncbi:YcnI family protein [Actinoplanes sp. KI2]|uniref:YcnI family protein n=1 Tax=Actinoplanes sp. KI2 TaxID=2983315 RepID=UPI0021D573DF|nr:YcnI family protein [Actinoplanes sp. KI2]MCU7722602.1 YcnI family protein [Actinoplanes sp. KI2]